MLDDVPPMPDGFWQSVAHTPQSKPLLHPAYNVGDRVVVDSSTTDIGRELHGEICGVAWAHIIFAYIVLLDEPLSVAGYDKPWRAISVPGGCLRLE